VSSFSSLEDLSRAEHEDVVVVRRPSGLHAVIAIHSTVLGPSLGGARFHRYPSVEHALHDVLRLSRGMTAKAALAGLAQGGGKAVILGDPSAEKTAAVLDDFAAMVDALDGRYITAEDVGTTEADMDRIRDTTPYVGGTSFERGGSGDPSPATAVGVVCAMEAAAVDRWGEGLRGKTVMVMGVGKVGGGVVRLLVERDVAVLVSDVDPRRTEQAMRDGAREVVDPSVALQTSAAVVCPCALGGVITDDVVAELRCEIIVGAANNQLATPEVADELAAAGVLYVPDYLANAGGIINIAEESGGYDPARARLAVERIGATTTSVLRTASEQGLTPMAAADAIVRDRLERARDESSL
jgi:glutamate dehydrogenase/leucine dehydrogenase